MHTTIIGSRRARAAASVLLAAMLAACENPADTPAKGPPGLTIVSGAGVSDSVGALLSAPLIVDVRDADGRALRGVEVEFRPGRRTHSSGQDVAVLGVSAVDGADFRSVLLVVTDRNGRASVRVAMGNAAGPAPLEVSVPTQALVDTAEYTVQPGAPLYLDVAPQDTALVVGASYPLRISVTDRWRNPLPGPTISMDPASAGVAVSGSTVHAVSTGRGHIRLRVGSLTAEAFVSAVPAGILTASTNEGIYQFSTDGSAMLRVTADHGIWFRWFSDGQKFVYTESRRLRFSLPGGGHPPGLHRSRHERGGGRALVPGRGQGVLHRP